MAIDAKVVRHVARLARLALTAAEEERFAAQLSSVLGYIAQLEQVDVSRVSPLSFAGDAAAAGAESTLRADEVLPGLPREEALRAAPAHDARAFLVPRIIE